MLATPSIVNPKGSDQCNTVYEYVKYACKLTFFEEAQVRVALEARGEQRKCFHSKFSISLSWNLKSTNKI